MPSGIRIKMIFVQDILAEGDFDFFNGNHMRVLDNLLADVIQPWKDRPEVEYVHLCPIRADVRESLVNQWDVPEDRYRKFIFGEEQKKKFLKVQNKIDKKDFAIIEALNSTKSIAICLILICWRSYPA